MDGALYLAVIVSFAVTWITARKWIRKAPGVGLVGLDMNKPGKPKVAEMGGVCVVLGFVLGMLA
jgi:UDP-N-acetylglucosamine--dolichyl-phosphate N-acetylglucosaminephosphotransferase